MVSGIYLPGDFIKPHTIRDLYTIKEVEESEIRPQSGGGPDYWDAIQEIARSSQIADPKEK